MELIKQIQTGLLDANSGISNILRKAKVLASQLESDDLKEWVSQELNGYENRDDLPDYRIFRTNCWGTVTTGIQIVHNVGLPASIIENDDVRQALTSYPVFQGIRAIEQLASQSEWKVAVSPDVLALANMYVIRKQDFYFLDLYYAILPHDFEQIIDTVKTRLLDFILTLGKEWKPGNYVPSQDKVNQLVSVHIYNNPQGGNVTTFDQRGQQVNYQYNAAGNINIQTVQNIEQLVIELEKLQTEIGKAREAGAIGKDEALEAEFHLLQATKEAKKPEPNKASFLDHVGKAKALLEDAKAAVGLVTALLTAAEIAKRIF